MATQTSVVREALKNNPSITIEEIIRYGLESYNIVIREHTIYNCLKKMAVEEEMEKLRKENEQLKKQTATPKKKRG